MLFKKLIIICILTFAHVFCQEKYQFPKKTTLIKAKLILQDQIKEIENLNNLTDFRIELSTAKQKSNTPKDILIDKKLFTLNSDSEITESLNKYYNSRIFTQTMAGKYCFIKTNDDYYNMQDELNAKLEYFFPKITQLTFIFHDKTQKTVKYEEYIFEKVFDFGKLIEKINIEYEFEKPEIKNIVKLNLENKTYTDVDKFINLIVLKPNNVTFSLSDTLKNSIVGVVFLNKNNQSLNSSGSSYNSLPSDETIKFSNEIGVILKAAITDITSKKITTVKVLEEKINEKTSLLKPITDLSNKGIYKYQVDGTPVSVNIYLSENKKKITGTATFNVLESVKPIGPYYIAIDTLSKKSGFVDANGKWFKKDLADQINPLQGNYYNFVTPKPIQKDADFTEYDTKVHKLDPIEKEIISYNWNFINQIAPGILKIQKETNGAYGVVDFETTKEILPIKYGYLELFDEVLIARESEFTYGDGLYGVFRTNGEVILPCIYRNTSKTGKFIYANLKSDYKMAFTLSGKQITKDNTNITDEFGMDQIAVVEINGKKNYINTNGEIIFNTNGFEEIYPFSNGLAAVKNKSGLYGYINTEGKLIIPCVYENAFCFQKNYALVVNSTGQNQLINKQNQVYKTFKGTYSSVRYPIDGNEATYYIGGVSYDADGNIEAKKQ